MIAERINRALRPVPGWAVYGLGLLPLAWIVWLAVSGGLGVDPVKQIEHRLGDIGLQLLLASLVVTPLRRFAGINLLKFRRAIGLVAFFYVTLHFATWLFLDIQLRWSEIWADILKRPYITVGMIGFAALVPLALTSNDLSIRRLGAAAWRRLHRLAYPAVLAGALHYVLLVKAWPIEPLLYLAAAVALLALRLRPGSPRRQPIRN